MYTNITPNKSSRNGQPVNRLTIHCMAGHMTAKQCADYFAKSSTQASANYCIGNDGEVAISCPPEYRSWCSSNGDNDRKAITIEVSSDNKAPYVFDTKALETLMEFVPNVMKMYNKNILVYIKDKDEALKYQPKDNEMLLTYHRWFTETTTKKSCPGDWWMSMQDAFVKEINSKFEQNQTNENQPINPSNESEKEKFDKEILISLKNKIDSLFKVYGIE